MYVSALQHRNKLTTTTAAGCGGAGRGGAYEGFTQPLSAAKGFEGFQRPLSSPEGFARPPKDSEGL